MDSILVNTMPLCAGSWQTMQMVLALLRSRTVPRIQTETLIRSRSGVGQDVDEEDVKMRMRVKVQEHKALVISTALLLADKCNMCTVWKQFQPQLHVSIGWILQMWHSRLYSAKTDCFYHVYCHVPLGWSPQLVTRYACILNLDTVQTHNTLNCTQS